jgi:hypothetical protein
VEVIERGDAGLIRHFGLFWRIADDRASVDLRGHPNTQKASGREAARIARDSSLVDLIRDHPSVNFSRQSGIYILYGDYGPMYVGKSWKNDLGGRLEDHLHNKKKWDRFSWFGFWPVRLHGEKWQVSTANAESLRIEAGGAVRDVETLVIRGFGLTNVRSGHFTGALEWIQGPDH